MLPILIAFGIKVGTLIGVLLIIRLLILYANRSGISGEKFFLHTWLDNIDGHPEAQARVISGLLVAVAILGAAFLIR